MMLNKEGWEAKKGKLNKTVEKGKNSVSDFNTNDVEELALHMSYNIDSFVIAWSNGNEMQLRWCRTFLSKY